MGRDKAKDKFGDLLIAFANAKTTDEAIYTLIDESQRIFDFSSQFSKKAKKKFPAISPFMSLPKFKIILWKLILAERITTEEINDEFYDLYGLELVNLDPGRSTFKYCEIEFKNMPAYNGDLPNNCEPVQSHEILGIRGKDLQPTLVSNRDLEGYVKQYSESVETTLDEFLEDFLIDPKEPLGQKLQQLFKKLIVLRKAIQKYQNLLIEKRGHQEGKIEQFRIIRDLHRDIRRTQNGVGSLLDDVLEGNGLHENLHFKALVDYYNASTKALITIREDDCLVNVFQLVEGDFFSQCSAAPTQESSWKDYYDPHLYKTIISISIVEFFKVPQNKKLVRRCDNCGKYFIAKRPSKQRFCYPECRMAWHNRKRIESGEHARYKRERRKQGKATASYYG